MQGDTTSDSDNPARARTLTARSALGFIVLLGVVSLFADMTYEGGRSLAGQYLGLLGASAAAIAVTAGAGEFLGYGLHEAMDQIRAVLGPVLLSLVLYFKGRTQGGELAGYRIGFLLLLAPACAAVLFLMIARFLFRRKVGLVSRRLSGMLRSRPVEPPRPSTKYRVIPRSRPA